MTAGTMANFRQRVALPPQSIDWVARVKSVPAGDRGGRRRDRRHAAADGSGPRRPARSWDVPPAGAVGTGRPSGRSRDLRGAIEAVAYGDASTAWILSQCSICSMATAYLPTETGELMVGNDPNAVLAWGALPSGRAVREGDGWRIERQVVLRQRLAPCDLDGRTLPPLRADGTPMLDRTTALAVVRMFLFPKSDVTVNESWDVIGLRGTGSDSYSVENLFVPDDRQFDVNVQADHPGPALPHRQPSPVRSGRRRRRARRFARRRSTAFRAVASDEKKGMKNSLAIQSRARLGGGALAFGASAISMPRCARCGRRSRPANRNRSSIRSTCAARPRWRFTNARRSSTSRSTRPAPRQS